MSKLIYSVLLIATLTGVWAQEPVSIDPDVLDLEGKFITAMQSVALEDYDEALKKFKGIKNKVKNDGIIDFEIAKIYLVKNEKNDAERYVKKAIDKDDTKSIYKYFLLDLLKEEGKYEEAAQLMESMLNSQNFERLNYFKTSDLYQRANKTKKALAIIDLLEKKTGYSQEVEMHRVNILLRTKKYKQALNTLDKLEKKLGKNINIYLKKAMTYRLMNNSKKAIQNYKIILKLDPQNAVALSYLHSYEKFTQKEEDYVKSLFPIMRNPNVLLDKKIKMLIPFVNKANKGSELTKELKSASSILLEQYPDDAKSNALMADILYNSGDIEASESYYIASLESSKNNFEIWKQLMAIYSYLRKWDKLADLSEDAIDYYPNQVMGYYNAGKANINLGKTQKGLEYLDEALMYTGNKTKFKYEIVLLQAHSYIVIDKLKKAKKLLNNLDSDFKEKHPYYWEIKGDLEMKKGAIPMAKKYWNTSLELGNNTKRLINKLKTN